MRAAVWPRATRRDARLLVLRAPDGPAEDRRLADLPALLRAGDVLVVNDAATLPASLRGMTRAGAVEVRLAGQRDDAGGFSGVLFGAGTWRWRTEDRRAPPALAPGDRLTFGDGFGATIESVSSLSPRLVDLRFERACDALWRALYRVGRPVQYSYLCGPLALWHVQSPFAARPWALEMPSAGAALDVALLRELRRRGVLVQALTHAAGLSSTGEAALDAHLPLPERYEIPESTAAAVNTARRAGRRVIAAGTSVVRALESAALETGQVRAGSGMSTLRLGPSTPRRVVDGLLTGLHEPGTSHHALLQAFAPRPRLDAVCAQAERAGYLAHEFGDLSLVLAA